jgi:hydrogenase small subunit
MREVRKDMAVTRREFVTSLGMLAAAMGLSQTDLARVTEAFGHAGAWASPNEWTTKPKVIWVHGAECTGCSTSVVGLYEDAAGIAVPALSLSTAQALAVVGGGAVPADTNAAVAVLEAHPDPDHPYSHRTLNHLGLNVDGSNLAINIADVLIDFIDVQYHETIMGMGGDGAYSYLKREMDRPDTGPDSSAPFVLVVEGAVQDFHGGGYWGKPGTDGHSAPWCAIAMDGGPDATPHELSFDDVVTTLGNKPACKAIVAIGQCAAFGGIPACIGPNLLAKPSGTKSQTGAKGVFDFFISKGTYGTVSSPTKAAAKVINVPGCPVNPWWFTLTVVAWLVDAATASGTTPGVLGIIDGNFKIVGNVDGQRRLKAVYGNLLHGKYCPRYNDYAARRFVTKPGEYVAGSVAGGCLKNIGCKGLSTMSSCGRHGWNNAQPQNEALNAASDSPTHTKNEVPALYTSTDGVSKIGGCCLTAGAPCMGCTEKGYPDAFTPFVVR